VLKLRATHLALSKKPGKSREKSALCRKCERNSARVRMDRGGGGDRRDSAAGMVSPGELVVVALGGNALLKRGQKMDATTQLENARAAADSIAELVAAGYRVVLTHGNGPQVGQLATQAPETALYVLDAQTEGAIGYMLQSEIHNALCRKRAAAREVAAIVTQTLVSESDPAFDKPTKPIGRVLTREQADELEQAGYTVAEDGKDSYRRVVASPAPLKIIEQNVIAQLVRDDVLVVCCGGGGIPVIEDSVTKNIRGVDAVVDKDAASALLADALDARALVLLTDAAGVIPPESWAGDPYDRNAVAPILTLSTTREQLCESSPSDTDVASSCAALDEYAVGSMRPKVKAAMDFVAKQSDTSKSRYAVIGQLERALDVVEGRDGTRVIKQEREDARANESSKRGSAIGDTVPV